MYCSKLYVLEYTKITYWRSVGKEVSSDKVRWEEGIHKRREKEEEKKTEYMVLTENINPVLSTST